MLGNIQISYSSLLMCSLYSYVGQEATVRTGQQLELEQQTGSN